MDADEGRQSEASADLALDRLREAFEDIEAVNFVLTNIGGGWKVVLTRSMAYYGLTPDDAVDVALGAWKG